LEEILFGELGIRPWELAQMTYKEVILSVHGLRERDKMLKGWIRRATYIIGASTFGGKAVNDKFKRLWPDEDEATSNIGERQRRQLKRFKENEARKELIKFREAEAMKRAKHKIDGRT